MTSLTLRPELDLPMIGAGGLMGIRTGVSILLGALINYAILAPIMIQQGDIVPNAKGTIGFREITFWSLWGGVAMMTVASLLAFFAKPQMLIGAFAQAVPAAREADVRRARAHRAAAEVSLVGIPLLGVLVVLVMAHSFFGVEYWLSVVALVLVFVFCLIAINSTGLTSITPIGAMGKLTQLTFGVLAPGNKAVNLMTAGITGEVASHSANLLQDIKPGYMLGAKPRQQAVGHVLGVLAGAVLSVPVFYLVFLKLSRRADLLGPTLDGRLSASTPSSIPMPAATIWKAVADVLAKGLTRSSRRPRCAALAGIVVGIAAGSRAHGAPRTASRCRRSASGWASSSLPHLPVDVRWARSSSGSSRRRYPNKESKMNQVVVQNQEPICAGLIAGGALMGIAVAVAELWVH